MRFQATPTICAAALMGTAVSGCNQLLSQATGGRLVNRIDIRIINDSPRKVCAAKVTTPDGQLVSDNALAGGPIGIEPGASSVAQVDEKLGKVQIEVYSCDPSPLLLEKADADTANPQPIRVR